MTVTAVLGALNATVDGKRLAGAHLIFNPEPVWSPFVLIDYFVRAVDAVSQAVGIPSDDYTSSWRSFTLFSTASAS